jgi:hypothetical protein
MSTGRPKLYNTEAEVRAGKSRACHKAYLKRQGISEDVFIAKQDAVKRRKVFKLLKSLLLKLRGCENECEFTALEQAVGLIQPLVMQRKNASDLDDAPAFIQWESDSNSDDAPALEHELEQFKRLHDDMSQVFTRIAQMSGH